MDTEAVLGNVISGICGGLIVALVTHYLAKHRDRARDQETRLHAATGERDSRKRQFSAFLAQLRAEAVNTNDVVFPAFYKNKIPNLVHAAVSVQGDMNGSERLEFAGLLSEATQVSDNEWHAGNLKRTTIYRIDKIIESVNGKLGKTPS